MNNRSSFPRVLVPSVGVGLWVIVFLILTLSNWRFVLVSADGDPALHWRMGDWMLTHHAILHTDQFSHTQPDAPFITKEWLSEILFAGAGDRLGWNGFVLVAAILIATTLWLLHRQLLTENCEPLLAAGLVVLATFAMSQHWLARPHLFTHLLALLFALKLRAFARNRLPVTRLFAWLVPLMVMWVNLHGAFFIGFVLIGCYLVGMVLDRAQWARSKTFAFVLLGCLVASWLNPNGWNLHAHIIRFIHSPTLTGYTNEFRSPDFHSPAMHGFLLLLLVVAVLLTWIRPRLAKADIILLAVWGYFALHSVRNIPIFAIVAVPILGEYLSHWLRERWTGGRLPVTQRVAERFHRWQPGRAGAGVIVLTVGLVVYVMQTGRLRTDLLPDRFPVQAVEFLRQHPEQIHGEMFNAYGWGGYLMLALPEHKVFVDSRNDFYGARFMKAFDRADKVQPGWEEVFQKYNVGWTLLPVAHPLNSLLALQPKVWKDIYRDHVAVIYARR